MYHRQILYYRVLTLFARLRLIKIKPLDVMTIKLSFEISMTQF